MVELWQDWWQQRAEAVKKNCISCQQQQSKQQKVTQQQVWKSTRQPLRTTSSLEKITSKSPSIQTKVRKKLPFLGVFFKLFAQKLSFSSAI